MKKDLNKKMKINLKNLRAMMIPAIQRKANLNNHKVNSNPIKRKYNWMIVEAVSLMVVVSPKMVLLNLLNLMTANK